MKKLICALLAMLTFALPALTEEAVTIAADKNDLRLAGAFYVDYEADAIPLVFTQDVENVVISHDFGRSCSFSSLNAGDCVLVYAYVPDVIPNVTVRYSLPGSEKVYTKAIFQSGEDGHYFITEDPMVENARCVVQKLFELTRDEGYVQTFVAGDEFLALSEAIRRSLPEEVPESCYICKLDKVYETLLSEMYSPMGEAAQEKICRSLPSLLISAMNGSMGPTWLVTASILQTSESFYTFNDNFTSFILVFETDGEYVPVAAVAKSGENVMSISAQYIMKSAADMLAHIEDYAQDLMN